MMEPCAPRADGPGEVDGIFQTPWKQVMSKDRLGLESEAEQSHLLLLEGPTSSQVS